MVQPQSLVYMLRRREEVEGLARLRILPIFSLYAPSPLYLRYGLKGSYCPLVGKAGEAYCAVPLLLLHPLRI